MINSTFHILKRDYSKFNLKTNPFPYAGVPDANPTFYIGQENALSAVLQTVSTTILTEKSNHIIITGPYGCGKSHTLLYLQEQLKQIEIEDNSKPIVSYISQPSDKMVDLYREFMLSIGIENFQNFAREFIADIATDLVAEGKIEVDLPLPLTWTKIIYGNLLLSDVIPPALLKLNEVTKYGDFCKAFINLIYDEEALNAWEWLSGDGLEQTQRKMLSLSKNIDEKSVGRAFQAVKAILQSLHYRPLIILIDEFEAVESLPLNSKQKLLNSVRHLIDINGENLSLIIACAPDVWQSLISEYHAFSERIGKEACLKPLSVETTKELIQAYLEKETMKNRETYVLFSEECYELIFEKGMGNARRILMFCGKLLDYAIDTNISLITKESIIASNILS